jgi:hypothetical protein
MVLIIQVININIVFPKKMENSPPAGLLLILNFKSEGISFRLKKIFVGRL